nr:PAS domain S-box protein [Brasilonema bromeliae]
MTTRAPAELEREIAARLAAEETLQRNNQHLEARVRERTAELERTVASLRDLTRTLEGRVAERTTALAASENRFRAIFNSMFQFIGLMEPDGTLLEANETALVAGGITRDEAVGRPFWETRWWTVSPETQSRLREAIARAAQGELVRYEADVRGAGDRVITIDFSIKPVFDDAGRVVLLIPEGRDVTDRKRAEAALRESEEQFRTAFDAAPIGMAIVAPDGRWLRVNEALRELVGYSEEELLRTTFQTLTHPDDLETDLSLVRDVIAGRRRTYQLEKRYFRKDGRIVDVLLSVGLVRDDNGAPVHFISQIKDVTEQKRAERQTRASLKEKELLLKEIHHRVKNNLQIVSTLLDLQSEYIDDPRALAMFQECRGRVRSMALIHERLYRSHDLARVDFAEYVRRLADDLYHAYKLSDDEVRLELDVEVPPLPIDVAIPCGLLLNELMSNCFKHAFPDSMEGRVRVSLRPDGPDAIVLVVADDGVGLPPDFDFRAATSFGLQLVNTLAEQLGAEIDSPRGDGARFVVRFPAPTR